jgi:Fe2+ or Zn2+ uptake regulation protein
MDTLIALTTSQRIVLAAVPQIPVSAYSVRDRIGLPRTRLSLRSTQRVLSSLTAVGLVRIEDGADGTRLYRRA